MAASRRRTRAMQRGDVVEVEIPVIGLLRHTIVEEQEA
jgi:2-keto-4-pentenoate hydratase/2-oxohepta-3-ene-1,7-dioic acid hydratase in catechol pathway